MTIDNLPIKHLIRPISRIDVYDLNGTPTGYLQRIVEQNDLDGRLTKAVYIYIHCVWLYEDEQDDKAVDDLRLPPIPVEFDLRKSIDITEDQAISASHYINENIKYPFGNISCVYSRDPLKTLPIGFSDNMFRPMMQVSEYITRTLLGLSGDKDILIVTIDIDED